MFNAEYRKFSQNQRYNKIRKFDYKLYCYKK